MNNTLNQLQEIALRIRDMREILDLSIEEMARQTELDVQTYIQYESGNVDLPFSFIHKCAKIYDIEMAELLEGHSAHLSNYAVTRKGKGITTAKEDGITIQNLAPMFRNKLAEPYWVKYEYKPELQEQPIHTVTHSGQEFNLVVEGTLMVRVGDKVETLHEGDSILFNSSVPHGEIAVGGKDCTFLAVVLPGEKVAEKEIRKTFVPSRKEQPLLIEQFVECVEDEHGALESISFKNEDKFNFAFDIVDAIADKYPEKLAMLHLDVNQNERRFTFMDMKRLSAQTVNYFRSLGIERGDRVLVILKRHWQFWPVMLALHKLGAIPIPATNQLVAHDLEYRFNAAGVKAVLCTADGDVAHQVDLALPLSPTLKHRIIVNGVREGWHNYDTESLLFTHKYERPADAPCGEDPMLMLFTSGTTGYPKIATHNHKYALGHFITAKYWHCVQRDGLHLTISDTGWGKALWGKFYGQWMCEGGVFTYDFDRFDASQILPMFGKYRITTFCAPPTMLRMLCKQDISKYDLSSIKHMTTAGEALNPEVYRLFEEKTGLQIMEGFGQTETTLSIANLVGRSHKVGCMGRPTPLCDVCLLDAEGNPVAPGENGEICIRVKDGQKPCGLFMGYFKGDVCDEEKTAEVLHDGWYHTGDVAWQDEDGFLTYVSRVDDVIKSSGYRIGPFEIESVIMELPYVMECGVSAAPDEVRGQVVKASIVLTKGTEPTEELKKEIQNYVKEHTAPYKYPRIVVFRDELPKTISGKIQRNKL